MKSKKKNYEKDWQLGKNKLRSFSNAWMNQAGVLDKIRSLFVPHYTQD